jgi:excisionase family DNA binding protein
MSASPFLTPREVAERLRISVRTLYNRRNRHRDPIPSVAEGKRVLYRVADVEAYLRQLEPS